MGKDKKRVLNLGYAFDEERVLKKFRKLSKEGWTLKKSNILNYELVKGEKKEQIYSMDYRDFSKNKEGLDEYIEIFKAGGWEYVCSNQNMFHFFKANVGTKPIYATKKEEAEKYRDIYKISKITALVSVICLLLSIIFIVKTKGISIILLVILASSAGILMPSIMMILALNRKFKKS
ncbi:hypothetical protein U729_2248 [Clostridium baratii str. Sullivan]|uniref:DUF2812 domain-containing protein n=1 Tax=Clostridium baratii str. Sullivan TaxID=1415775 RepID=A0A0A7FY12_9CLOT|nr:DUF2812 domain-containing protein [Clostridium baratii]AIY83711.1 hypothetical protein U729_2248 [Clostridium baratii str. Sullivan]